MLEGQCLLAHGVDRYLGEHQRDVGILGRPAAACALSIFLSLSKPGRHGETHSFLPVYDLDLRHLCRP